MSYYADTVFLGEAIEVARVLCVAVIGLFIVSLVTGVLRVRNPTG